MCDGPSSLLFRVICPVVVEVFHSNHRCGHDMWHYGLHPLGTINLSISCHIIYEYFSQDQAAYLDSPVAIPSQEPFVLTWLKQRTFLWPAASLTFVNLAVFSGKKSDIRLLQTTNCEMARHRLSEILVFPSNPLLYILGIEQSLLIGSEYLANSNRRNYCGSSEGSEGHSDSCVRIGNDTVCKESMQSSLFAFSNWLLRTQFTGDWSHRLHSNTEITTHTSLKC